MDVLGEACERDGSECLLRVSFKPVNVTKVEDIRLLWAATLKQYKKKKRQRKRADVKFAGLGEKNICQKVSKFGKI